MNLVQAIRILTDKRAENSVARSLTDQLVESARSGYVHPSHGSYNVLADRAINYAEVIAARPTYPEA